MPPARSIVRCWLLANRPTDARSGPSAFMPIYRPLGTSPAAPSVVLALVPNDAYRPAACPCVRPAAFPYFAYR